MSKLIPKLSYNISTITMSIQIPNCTLNLTNIGKYLNIDETIIGIKYNFGKESILKGTYSTAIYKKSKTKNSVKINKQLFYNQISIIVKFKNEKLEERTVNIKLFGNGTLHLTGIRNPNESKKCMILIYEKLLNLIDQYNNILLTLDANNVYIDNNNNVYSKNSENNKRSIIGYKYTNINQVIYNINKKDYEIDIKTGFFISKKFETKRTKSIVNFNGDKIGYSKIELLKNKSKLYKNNSNITIDYVNGFIYYDGNEKSSIIGNIIYNIYDNNDNKNDNNDNNDNTISNIIEYKYNCNPFLNNSKIYDLNDFNNMPLSELEDDINCINIYFKLEYQLNRQRLFNELLKKNFICEYKPEKYAGIKLRYKVSKNTLVNGICNCSTTCTCNTITFLIFQSGNIIVTGFKSISHIDSILNNFQIILYDIVSFIKKKTLVLI
jgi:TATA-box binding protein (TBP) (component of TFIID and TFIIIB)